MMTLEQIRERNCKENAAARRLQAAGYRLEGWDPRTGQRIAAQITNENTNAERRTFYSFPTWQDAAAGLNAHRMPWQSRTGQSGPAPLPRQPLGAQPNINPRTKEHTP